MVKTGSSVFISCLFLFSVFAGFSAFGSDNSENNIPHLQKIIINGDSVISVPVVVVDYEKFLKQKLILDFKKNNILFEFSANDSLEFQYYLKGFDNGWSTWKKSNYKEYTNLPVGKYSFNVRYQTRDGVKGELEPYNIRVNPVWYNSGVAIIFYLILIFLIIWQIYDFLTLKFAKRQYMLEMIINKRTEDLIIEKEKTENLLANVLPKNTADELMAKGKASKIKYNFVTVLFSDIQGFTKIAEEMNPEVLIDELDKFFFHFDSVAEKYRIEKIKTIGDAYMCAGGIPEKNRTNPVEVILAALEMKMYMTKLKESTELSGMKYWDIRIGIHTGTVVAGVVGHKKLSYDIWGDTVNTASRMESSGAAGKINISGTTYEFVKEFFACEFRGKMPVKYKGELEMYFVESILPELQDENGGPNKKFITKMQLIKLQDIEEFVIKMFEDEAPPDLYFHNSSLVKNICNQVELISVAENLPETEYINLKLAGVFLLTGYISDYEKPMEGSFRIVEEILPANGFYHESIEETKRIIKNAYTSNIESNADKILHDAQNDYLGRVDFAKLTDKLLRERTAYGKGCDNKAWIDLQIKYLREHDFITETARLLRSVSLEEQEESLKRNSQERIS
jgi:adenylate cyclase